jgi:hypothetical protein
MFLCFLLLAPATVQFCQTFFPFCERSILSIHISILRMFDHSKLKSKNLKNSWFIQERYFEGNKFRNLDTPSAPPIAGGEEEVMFDAVGKNIRIFVVETQLSNFL